MEFEFGFDPVPIPGNGKDASLLVGVTDAVADAPIIPCGDVEVESMPAAVAEAVCVSAMPAVFVGGSVLVGLGVEDGPPGRAVEVGSSIPFGVGVGVQVGRGIPVAVGVRPYVQGAVPVGVKL